MTKYAYPYKRGTGWRSQGFRSNPNSGANGAGGHTGFDQAMPVGTPLYAPADGIVRNSSWLTANYLENPWWLTQMGGDTLVLDCTDSFGRSDTMPTFIFAHLSNSIAEVGQRVKKGQLIALSGNSGTATTGAHVHIEALPPNWDFNNGVYGRVDPESYFTEYPGEVTTQGTITQEAELSAAEVQAIKDHINAVMIGGYTWADGKHYGGNAVSERTQKLVDGLPAKLWATPVARGGGKISALQELADCKSMLIAQQGQFAGLLSAIEQLAKAPGAPVDLAAVTAAAEAGAQKALSGLSVTIKQGEAL